MRSFIYVLYDSVPYELLVYFEKVYVHNSYILNENSSNLYMFA
jgi:hypothetical protein